jgi:VanZ family protein
LYFVVIAFNALVAAFVSKTPYRRLINDGLFNESIVADFLCSFFFTFALPFVFFSIFSPRTRPFGFTIVATTTHIMILHEFMQSFTPGTFDPLDLVANTVAGVLAAAAFAAVYKIEKN